MFSHQTWLVAKNTYRQRVKGFGYWAMVLSPFLIAAVYLLIGLIVSSGVNQKTDVAIVNNPALTQVLKADKSLNSDFTETASLAQAKEKLKSGDIDAYLEVTNGEFVMMTSNSANTQISESDFQQALNSVQMQQTAQKLKLSGPELQQLLTPAKFSMKTLSESGTEAGGDDKTGANIGISTVTSMLIFLLLMLYVGLIGQEIGNEKSSRIMETLLATTSSNVQYYGKIIGITLLAVTQIALYSIGAAIAYPFVKNMDAVKAIFSLLSGIDLTFGIYLILMSFIGILGYLFLAAIIASLVNEQAQVQQATQPIAFFSLIGYIGGIAGAAVPGNIILKILSFVPFISPTLMSSRYAIQYSSTTEAFIAVLFQLIATVAVAKAGEKIYARNVLSYSDDKIMVQLFNNIRGKDQTKKSLKEKEDSAGGKLSLNKRLSLPVRLVIALVIIVIVFLVHFLMK